VVVRPWCAAHQGGGGPARVGPKTPPPPPPPGLPLGPSPEQALHLAGFGSGFGGPQAAFVCEFAVHHSSALPATNNYDENVGGHHGVLTEGLHSYTCV
jgi:hypothetical protein